MKPAMTEFPKTNMIRDLMDSENRNDWIQLEINIIPEEEYYKLQGEFNYRYVNDDEVDYVDEWIINQYSLRTSNETKCYEGREDQINAQFITNRTSKSPMKRNVSIGLSHLVKTDFEVRHANPTQRVNELVERIQELQTSGYVINLEPLEKQILLGVAASFSRNAAPINSKFIKKLPSLVIDSEYYLKDDPGARSLYQKLEGKDYVSLLATIEFYNL